MQCRNEVKAGKIAEVIVGKTIKMAADKTMKVVTNRCETKKSDG